MKKRILFFISYFIFSLSILAQGINLGLNAETQFVIGDNSTYFKNSTGMGTCVELEFSKYIGTSCRFNYARVIPADSRIESGQQFIFLLGLFGRLPINDSFLYVKPGIEFGEVFQSIILKPEYDSLPEDFYSDFVIRISTALIINPQQLAKGHFDFELAPLCTIIPMRDNVISFIGARLSVLYKFN